MPRHTTGTGNTGGLEIAELKDLKVVKGDRGKLNWMYADLALGNQALTDLFEKKH